MVSTRLPLLRLVKITLGMLQTPRKCCCTIENEQFKVLILIEKPTTAISKAKVEDFLYDGGNDEGVVEAMIAFHLKDKELAILPENELTDVVNSVVTRQAKDELETYVFDVVKDTRAHIDLTAALEDDKKMETAIAENRTRRKDNFTETHGESINQTTKSQMVRDFSKTGSKKVVVNEDDDFDEGFDTKVMYIVNAKSTLSQTKGRKTSANSQLRDLSDIDSFSDNEISQASAAKKQRAAPAKKPAKSLGGSTRATTRKTNNPFGR